MSGIDSILGDAPFDLAAKPEAVPLLRTVVLPPDAREIRISDWFGMIAGSPIPFLSLRQDGTELRVLWQSSMAVAEIPMFKVLNGAAGR